MKNLIHTLQYIVHHPMNSTDKFGSILRFAKWQLNTRLNPYPVVYSFTSKSKLLMWKGLVGATGNLYCGLMEFQDMGFLLHFLLPSDLFVDVGANVGVYTVLASGEVGATSISIEPVPSTFKVLEDNIALNKLDRLVTALNIGLGEQKGLLKFTRSLDAENHVATPGETDTIDVPVDNLDHVLAGKVPLLLKIDVEGYETEVLKGAKSTLAKEGLQAIIIELNGSGNRYGYDERLIHQDLLAFGFVPCAYDPFRRKLSQVPTYGTHNTIYVRDMAIVEHRLKHARKVKVQNREF